MQLKYIILCCLYFGQTRGHGYMTEPPSRSSMWRNSFPTVPNYNDNGLNCGGRLNLATNGGKCGVCGDPYQGPYLNEAGGIYAKGIITRTYNPGQNINVKIYITADHRGWFEFRLCVNNDITKRITHDCLNKHVLTTADGRTTRTRFTAGRGTKTLVLRLPEDITCTQCVLQWKWRTANSPGSNEEEYYGCSDIAIRNSRSLTSLSTPIHHTTKTYGGFTKQIATIAQTTTPEYRPPSSRQPDLVTESVSRCRAIAVYWKGIPTFDYWCNSQCKGSICPSHLKSFCLCV